MKVLSFVETLVWGFLLGVVFYNQYRHFNGVYNDVDTYMQLVWMKEFSLASWFNTLLESSNSPFGETIIFTRLFDLAWAVCGIPFLKISDPVVRLFYSGFGVMPLGIFLMLLSFIWGTRSCLLWMTRVVVLAALLLQKQIYPDFALSGYALKVYLSLFMVLMSVCWWNFAFYNKPGYIVSAAVAAALATWLCSEGFVMACIFGLGILLAWVFCKIETFHVLLYSWVYAVAVTLFWLVNPPEEGFKALLLLRLSLFQVVTAWLTYIGVFVYNVLPLKTGIRRFCAFLTGFPFMVVGVYVLTGIQRFRMLPLSPFDALTDIFTQRFITGGLNLTFFIYPAVAALVGLLLLLSSRFRAVSFVSLLLCVGTAGAMFLNISYAGMAAIAAALLLALGLQFIYECRFTGAKVFFALVAAGCIGLEFGILEYYPPRAVASSVKHVTKADVEDIAALYAQPPGTVFSDVFYGPVILWYTYHNVVGTPNFYNRQAIIDSDKIWKTNDITERLALLKKYNVDYIFLPENYDKKYFAEPEAHPDTLYGQIITGQNLPKWLKAEEIKSGEKYYLYRVRPMYMSENGIKNQSVNAHTIFLPQR